MRPQEAQDAPRDLSGADGRPLIPRVRLDARIAPTCPKGVRKGRQPHPLPAMLRVHCVQPFCNLSDPMMEDRLAMPRASGCLDGASPEKVPDEATISTSAAGWSAADWRTCRSGDR